MLDFGSDGELPARAPNRCFSSQVDDLFAFTEGVLEPMQ